MKDLYYFGFYTNKFSLNRDVCENFAGVKKMDYLISKLNEIGINVNVLSINIPSKVGLYKTEKIHVNECLSVTYLPVLRLKILKRNFLSGRLSVLLSFIWILINIKNKSTLFVYHSLIFYPAIVLLKRIKKFNIILQVEDLYTQSKNKSNKKLLHRELKNIEIGNKYLFVNDIFPNIISNKKPYLISYGNYSSVANYRNKFVDSQVNLVYTGIISEERGFLQILSIMEYLPNNYFLYILGYGNKNTVNTFKIKIDEFNSNFNFQRIFYDGTLIGDEFDNYLSKKDIGISYVIDNEDISKSIFPSKIITYLSHNLEVISTKNYSVVNSKIADFIYFANYDPKDFAKVILSIDTKKAVENHKLIENLNTEFVYDLKRLFFQ